MSDQGAAERYRLRAEELRVIAAGMTSEGRAALLQVAKDYDKMAVQRDMLSAREAKDDAGKDASKDEEKRNE